MAQGPAPPHPPAACPADASPDAWLHDPLQATPQDPPLLHASVTVAAWHPAGTAAASGHSSAAARLASGYWHSGVALISTAAFLFSCQSLAIKLLGGRVPTLQVVLYPALLCFLLTSGVVRWYGLRVSHPSWRVTALTLARGVLGATTIVCFYLSVVALPLKDAVTLFFCSPVITSVMEWAVTGESHGWSGIAGIASTALGVVLVTQPESFFAHTAASGAAAPADGSRAVGMALATAAAVANGLAFLTVRLLQQTQPAAVLTWWYHLVVVAISSAGLMLQNPMGLAGGASTHRHHGGSHGGAVLAHPETLRDAGLLAAVACTQFCGQLLLNRGFQLISATRGSAVNVLQVPFSFLWDLVVLGDPATPLSIAGSACVAAGVLSVALTNAAPAAGHIAGRGHEHWHAHSNGQVPTMLVTHDYEHEGADDGLAGLQEQPLKEPLMLRVAGRLSLESAT